jgi:hypothetical protein
MNLIVHWFVDLTLSIPVGAGTALGKKYRALSALKGRSIP